MAFQGASSSFTGPWKYDVFLSFRGVDTRDNFIAHLHRALFQNGITIFIDDDELKMGEEISPALHQAIEQSSISIVVFSQNYASSGWCLNELLKIRDCKETNGQMVLPVFYKVDPSDVRHQKNSFEGAFARHEERFKDDIRVQNWKAVLTQMANLSGLHSEHFRNEAQFIDKIVQDVSRIVNHTYFQVAKHPVGIVSRVQEINSLLSIDQMNGVRMIGILGAGGIGKTTIAKAIYNLMASQFEGSCFLENVRENSKQNSDLVKLQNTLLSKILGRTVKVDSVDEGIIVIKKRFCSKKVLLVLDDVDNQLVQLDKLAGNVDWFGLGSRIIITTRDRKVLTNHGVVDALIYKVKELDHNEALELFCLNAFKEDKPTDDFLKLMEGAISYVGGLPLALEVLGSYMYRKDICQWISALNKYKNIPHENILERLRISYDGLHPNDKNLFLDIACFFIGRWTGNDIIMLDSCDYSSIDGINVLIERSLITFDDQDFLAMHNLLRDMGREVVRQESPDEPGKRSRLWFHKDVRQVLEDDTGTNTIQGILIDLPNGDDMVHLSSKAFENMRSLRLLMVIPNARFSTGPNFLPNKLRVLDWPNCPLESLPSNFHGRNLIVLRMPGSPLKELKGIKNFQEMKIMDFMKCKFLKTTPDVSSIPNLEDFILDKCTNLVEIHHSVGCHDKLVRLSIRRCYNLSSFPGRLKLRSLKYLDVKGCSSLSNFPEIECEMKYLKFIDFGGTGIKELPPSIRYLTGLQKLGLEGCINLTNLPSSIYELQHLKYLVLIHCSKLAKFPKKIGDSRQSMPPHTNSSVSNDDCSLKAFPALKHLYLNDCVLLESADFLRIFSCYSTLRTLVLSGSGIVTVPACIKRFVALWGFEFHGCKQLREIQAFPPISVYDAVDARGCMSLECWLLELLIAEPVGSGIELKASSIQEHREKRLFTILISGNKIPDRFSYCKEVSNSHSCEIEIDVPANLDGEISRIVFSAVIETEYYVFPSISVVVISGGVQIYPPTKFMFLFESLFGAESDTIWLRYYVPEPGELKYYNGHLRVIFVHKNNVCGDENLRCMKRCGVHLVRRCKEKAKDSIGGIHEVTKKPRDDDDNDDDEKFESNCYPQKQEAFFSLGHQNFRYRGRGRG